jgi:hypothetical protein
MNCRKSWERIMLQQKIEAKARDYEKAKRWVIAALMWRKIGRGVDATLCELMAQEVAERDTGT